MKSFVLVMTTLALAKALPLKNEKVATELETELDEEKIGAPMNDPAPNPFVHWIFGPPGGGNAGGNGGNGGQAAGGSSASGGHGGAGGGNGGFLFGKRTIDAPMNDPAPNPFLHWIFGPPGGGNVGGNGGHGGQAEGGSSANGGHGGAGGGNGGFLFGKRTIDAPMNDPAPNPFVHWIFGPPGGGNAGGNGGNGGQAEGGSSANAGHGGAGGGNGGFLFGKRTIETERYDE